MSRGVAGALVVGANTVFAAAANLCLLVEGRPEFVVWAAGYTAGMLVATLAVVLGLGRAAR